MPEIESLRADNIPRDRDQVNSVEDNEQRTLLNRCTRTHFDASNGSGSGRPQLVLHLHRFHHYNALPGFDFVADGNVDPHNEAGHRRQHRRWPARTRIRCRYVADPASPLVESFDLEPVAIDPQRISAATRTLLRDDTINVRTDLYHSHWTPFNIRKLGVLRLLALVRGIRLIQGDQASLSIYFDDVSHVPRPVGRSSQTVSTWAVCGNMSKPRSD